MADKTISQLTGATTPLAGTEIVPLVQSSTTKNVSVANLTAGRAVSAAQLDVDNVRVDGNTISTTNTNGNLTLTPNGTGLVVSSSNMEVNSLTFGRGKVNDTNSVVLGYGAAQSLQAGSVQNTNIGAFAAYSTTTGKRQTAVGYGALYYSTTGDLNAAVGHSCMLGNTTGGYNAVVGDFALSVNANGFYNAALGTSAGAAAVSGNYNSFFGYSSGSTLTSGSNNGFFGYNAQPSAVGVSNEYTYGNADVTKHRFPGGDIVIGTAGKGIDFSANTNAAGMTSELLADYEEGTFTPVVAGSSTAGTATYSTQEGTYTKVGRLVTFRIYVVWTSGTGTGSMDVNGLPFASNAIGAVTVAYFDQITLTASNYLTGALTLTSGTNIRLYQSPVAGGYAAPVTYSAQGGLVISGQYFV
jgi:hypothetical protein